MKRKKRIIVLCPSPEGTAATQRLKYEQYFPIFDERGYDMVVAPFQTQRFWKIIYKEGRMVEKMFWIFIGYLRRTLDLFRLPFFDGVYISLNVTPLGFPFFEHIIFFFNKNVVYDLDDMLFLGKEGNSHYGNRFVDRLKGRNKPLVLMRKSKYVIVCTPKLEAFAKKINPNVVDISSTFNTDRFTPVKDYSQNQVTTLGWTGTHSNLQYLDLLKDVLVRIAKQRKIKLLIICNKSHSIEGVDTEWIPWTEENEIDDLHRIEIGLYPGLKDTWSLGKSGLKALTYMAIGIPALALAWGANFRIIEHEKNGFLLDTEKDWEQTILELIDNPSLRKRIGLAARKSVEDNFSVKANSIKYLTAFKESYN